jgi:hypothetical protein
MEAAHNRPCHGLAHMRPAMNTGRVGFYGGAITP